MANSLRDVKIRIESTKSTAQITKAMYMVSQSKVTKALDQYTGYKDFMQRIADLVYNVASDESILDVHPLLKEREIKKRCYLIITSDRGLAGVYNSSIYKSLEEEVSNKSDFIVAAIGKQGYSFLKRKKYEMIKDEPTLVRDDVMFLDIVPLANEIIDMYLNNEIDELIIIYNHYINSLTNEIHKERILPISKIEGSKSNENYIFEAGVMHTLDMILPMYVKDMIYGIILDAKSAEHCSRRNAMKNATDNAEKVISKLQILYNRARQDVITNELIDIVGGANAIGGDN